MAHLVTSAIDEGSNMITQRMTDEGNWIFRYRGVLPLLLVFPAAWSMADFRYLGESHELQHIWSWGCVAISILGYILRITTVGFVPRGTSGRNTLAQRADSLNTSGWYSVMRNPLYLGNFLIGLGFVSTSVDLLLVLVYVGFFWLYYERVISAEECYLEQKFGAEYKAWAAVTPVFLPEFHLWRKPEMSFCTKTVLRREYSALLLIGVVFWVIDTIGHLIAEKRFYMDVSWTAFMLGCLTIFTILRSLKKHTHLLDVTGR